MKDLRIPFAGIFVLAVWFGSTSEAAFAGGKGDPGASKEEQAELWFAFRDIIETRCLKCHDGPGSSSGVNLNDYANLIKVRNDDRELFGFTWEQKPWQYIKPGRPKDSLLYQVISENYMPLGETKLSIGEKLTIKAWVEKNAPGAPAVEPRKFLAPRQEHQAIADYLQKLPGAERSQQRFFSLANLHNNRTVYGDHLRYYRAGLAKLLNSLSWQAKIVVPVAVPGTHEAVLAVDLRHLGWDQATWTELLKAYPYGTAADAALATKLQELTGTPVPMVRADWFAHAGSRPPLYHQLLQLPDNAVALEKKLGIDFSKNFLAKKLARAGYLGASTTTSGYRVAERQEINKYPGGYWRSYDFGQGMSPAGKGNPLIFPLGPFRENYPIADKSFIHQGSEILFNLPNGMQGYLVVDADDRRVNEAPTSVLKDKNEFSGSPTLVNGISCIACHAQGMNNVSDQVRKEATGKKFSGDLLDWVEAIYPGKDTMDGFLNRDRKQFVTAVDQAAGSFIPKGQALAVPLPKSEMIHALAANYRGKVGLEEAARELGYAEVDAFKKDLIARHEAVKGLGFKVSLLQEGGRISRQEWERVFCQAVLRLELGVPVLEPKVKRGVK